MKSEEKRDPLSPENLNLAISSHKQFLSLIAIAIHLRLNYWTLQVEHYKMDLAQRLQNELTKIEINQTFTPGQRKKLGLKAESKYFNKPAAAYEAEQKKINISLGEIVAGVHADSEILLITKVVEEAIKAKNPRMVVMLLNMYNQGIFDEVLKNGNNEPENKNDGNFGLVDLSGKPISTG